MATDKILVERETDGKWCGETDCPQYHEETDGCGSYCGAFPADDLSGESGFKMDADAGHRTLRTLACLATPSARELTPEMMGAVDGTLKLLEWLVDEHIAHIEANGLVRVEAARDKLRAAFGLEAEA